KEVFAEAVASVDEERARRVMDVGQWRKGYLGPVRDIVAAGAESGKNALNIASTGLASMRRHLTFVRDRDEIALDASFDLTPATTFNTGRIQGTAPRVEELSIPYRGEALRGDALKRRLDAWVAKGVMEESSSVAIESLIDNPGWLDLTDQDFVLVGAASQMGPLGPLLRWGARIAALDLPIAHIWDRIATTAREGAGLLTFPTRATEEDADAQLGNAGADLLLELPEVWNWMQSLDRPFVLGNYVYADGADFLRLAGAVDALIDRTAAAGRLGALAYLATPTDVYAVPDSLASEVRARKERSLLSGSLKVLTRGALYQPNYPDTVHGDEAEWAISDCLVPIQGPNYALAKAMQRWRAVVAREEDITTSANVAPATYTVSVTKNRMLAAAYSQAHRFGIEIFEPETSRILMAALLVHDLRTSSSSAPQGHPFDLFVDKAVHGGIWRSPYEPRSVLPIALARGMLPGRRSQHAP
ncbi:MAG: hypothetical protein QOH90_767, partial [Actinomycetota bacterium]|nr:hypothetical protein [Actinomycetota bacterium]